MAGELLGEQVLILGEELAELADQLGIELAAGALEQLGDRAFARAGRAIDVIGRHRVEGVDDREHAGRLRQGVAGDFLVRRLAVEAGAGEADDVEDVLRCVATGEDLDRHRRVASHRLGFFRREPAGLEQHFVRHADLADVVQQRGDLRARRVRPDRAPSPRPTNCSRAPRERCATRWPGPCSAARCASPLAMPSRA